MSIMFSSPQFCSSTLFTFVQFMPVTLTSHWQSGKFVKDWKYIFYFIVDVTFNSTIYLNDEK